jgi:hypothetical protein
MTPDKRFLVLLIAVLLGACSLGGDSGGPVATQSGSQLQPPSNAIQISIIYAPESARYLPQVIDDFNRSYINGTNPVTGQPLASGERPIFVTGESGSSGTIMQGIVNAIIAPNNANVQRPVIFQPSVSHWLALANLQAGRQVFDLADNRPTALAPVVMAIWESRLQAIRDTVGYDEIGWQELLGVLKSPNGWQDYGIPGGRRVYAATGPTSVRALST